MLTAQHACEAGLREELRRVDVSHPTRPDNAAEVTKAANEYRERLEKLVEAGNDVGDDCTLDDWMYFREQLTASRNLLAKKGKV